MIDDSIWNSKITLLSNEVKEKCAIYHVSFVVYVHMYT